MQEYIPLFVLAFIWTLFATIQDLKSREVANWLNFSLIAFALAYRAFYSSLTSNIHFFLLGLCGLAIMLLLGNAFYYSRAFAGGDAKLLIGFGVILPYLDYFSLVWLPILFVFLLFLAGSFYSLVYSLLILQKNRKKFLNEFSKQLKNKKPLFILSLVLCFIFLLASFYSLFFLSFAILSIVFPIYIYTRSLEKCLIVLTPPNKLTEGDWLEAPIKLNSKITIEKSVHGLSYKDIQLLRKYNRPALIKNGIPFVPSFLLAFLVFVFLFTKFPEFYNFFF